MKTTKKAKLPRLVVGQARVRAQIKELSAACVDVKPHSIDWREVAGDDNDGFESWEAIACQKCEATVVTNGQSFNERHCDVDRESTCTGSLDTAEGPMMNYWYPIGEKLDGEELARELGAGCLCVVRVGDEYGLALTGGGMDLSWQTFIKLGYLPPFHFSNLPAMCRGTSTQDLFTIAACKRTCDVVANRVLYVKEQLSMLTPREEERIARNAKEAKRAKKRVGGARS
jgi:hypothetical protein